MARTKISFTDDFIYECNIPVLIGNINYGNHLSNDAYLRLAHEARIRFLNKINLSEIDIGGCGLIMSSATIIFKSQVFYPETLLFKIAIEDITEIGFNLLYKVIKSSSNQEVAKIKTEMICFDYKANKITKTPDSFKVKINNLNS